MQKPVALLPHRAVPFLLFNYDFLFSFSFFFFFYSTTNFFYFNYVGRQVVPLTRIPSVIITIHNTIPQKLVATEMTRQWPRWLQHCSEPFDQPLCQRPTHGSVSWRPSTVQTAVAAATRRNHYWAMQVKTETKNTFPSNSLSCQYSWTVSFLCYPTIRWCIQFFYSQQVWQRRENILHLIQMPLTEEKTN